MCHGLLYERPRPLGDWNDIGHAAGCTLLAILAVVLVSALSWARLDHAQAMRRHEAVASAAVEPGNLFGETLTCEVRR